jgi:hypothetical protein
LPIDPDADHCVWESYGVGLVSQQRTSADEMERSVSSGYKKVALCDKK